MMFCLFVCLLIRQQLIRQSEKKEKSFDYILRWKSQGLYTSKLKLIYTAFLHGVNLSGKWE